MTGETTDTNQTLRQRAEALFNSGAAAAQPVRSLDEANLLLHELRVHQVELEMQSEELRRTQADLDASRARYFDLYDLAPVSYVTVGKPGLILEANLTAAALLGTARDALVKQPFASLIHKDDQELFYRLRQQLLATGDPQACELRLVKADGTVLWAQLAVTVAADVDRVPISRVVLSDITERKREEEERGKLERELEQAHNLEFVGRLAGGVAHDFNNMLQIILSLTEFQLAHAEPDAPLTADLREIMTAARRSADLTRQLLAFARKQTIAPKVLDLNDTVADRLQKLARLAGDEIKLIWRPAPGLGLVHVDPSQIDQILANLTGNARDAMAGAGTLSLQTGQAQFDEAYCQAHPDVLPGVYVMLAVSDTGCGMDVETLAHLFEPFFTTKEQGRGTGLGLATVYGIVKQNNGFVTVESAPGKGTTFRVYLPRHAATAAETTEVQPGFMPPTGTTTVLLVEDEAPLLRLARRLLEDLGYTVLAADGPQEALRVAGAYAGDIQLLLTDVVMPGLSGRDLRERLRPSRPEMKCLFMSGYTADVIAYRGVLDDGLHFLQKPFSRAALAAKLDEVLAGVCDRATQAVPDMSSAAASRWGTAVAARGDATSPSEGLSPDAARQMLHELRAYEIEGEIQHGELRRTQTELAASQARYFELYDLAPVGYVTLSEMGLILEANLAAATLLGMSQGALVKQPLSRFILAEDHDVWQVHRTRLSETDAPQECELRMAKEDGTPFWAHLVATAVQGPDGALGCRLVLNDVTARRRAEQALREGELQHRAILHTAMDGFCQADMHGRLLDVNGTYCRMSGYSAQELLTMSISDLDIDEAAADTASHIQKIKAQGTDRFESRHRRKDGTVFDVEVSVQHRATGGGVCVAFMRDITERKRADEALRVSGIRLRQLAVELARVEERERQRLALCLHDEVAQTLAVLRMKLGILATTLSAGPAQAEIAQIRGLLQKSIDQTRSLVFDLSPPILRQLGLVAAVEWAGEKIRQEHGLTFVCRDAGEPEVLDDERKGLLFRCTRELMMNTVKHAKATRLTTEVRGRGDEVSVTVEDDGCGFDVTRLDRGAPETVGFGLLSVRERMASAGGRCEITSEPGHGTRVTLTVPARP